MNKSRVLNILFQISEKVLRIIYIFLSTYIIATILTVSEFGEFNFFIALLTIGVGVCQLGFENTVTLRLAKSNDNLYKEKLRNTALLIRIISVLIYFFLVILFMVLTRNTLDETYVYIILICLLLSCFNIFEYDLIVNEQGSKILVIRSIAYILSTIYLLFIIQLSHNSLISSYLIIEFFSIALLLYVNSFNLIKAKKYFSFLSINEIKKLLIESFPLFLSSIGIMLYMRLDIIMLNTMTSSSDVGMYSLAVRFSESVNFIPVVIMTAIYPYLIKNNLNDNFKILFDFMFQISLVSIISIFFIFPYIIKYFFGPDYINSSTIANILILQTIPVFLGIVRARYLVINGYQKYIPYFVFSGLLFNIIANLILIHYYGVIGAAVATLLSQIVSTLLFPMMFKQLRPITKQMFTSIFTLGLGVYIHIFTMHKNKK
ncbi:oligosaccharide flippase family protein [Providencia stuartii]|nr:oligosaccharide flippase family protein [Providencia stuartii]